MAYTNMTANKITPEACCTCAALLSALCSASSFSEKGLPDSHNRRLNCCGRTICGNCIQKNPRFQSYCPYCQTSGRVPSLTRSSPDKKLSVPSETEATYLDDDTNDDKPPPYSVIASNVKSSSPGPLPPPYTATPSQTSPPQEGYIVHRLRHSHPRDTIASLSLRYGIYPTILRLHNKLPSDADQLLAARQTLLIPVAYCSKLPPQTEGDRKDGEVEEDEAERKRKVLIRRWMVACKEPDYDVATVYLEGCGWDLQEAVEAYWADWEWERENPLEKGKSGRKGVVVGTMGKGMGKREKEGLVGWGLGLRWGRR